MRNNTVFLVVSYPLGSSDKSVRVIEGYTESEYLAIAYALSRLGDFHILRYDGDDIREQIFEDFKYNVLDDEALKIFIISTYDGMRSVADTVHSAEELVYEAGVVDQIEKDSTVSYLNMVILSRYVRDLNFDKLNRYLCGKYLFHFIKWFHDDTVNASYHEFFPREYVYEQIHNSTPVDLVAYLIDQGYFKEL